MKVTTFSTRVFHWNATINGNGEWKIYSTKCMSSCCISDLDLNEKEKQEFLIFLTKIVFFSSVNVFFI